MATSSILEPSLIGAILKGENGLVNSLFLMT